MMTKEQEQTIIRREEIKIRAIEYWEARRIIRTFDRLNDEITKPILEIQGVRTKAMCSTKQCINCSSQTCDSSFLSCYNSLRRKARQIYYEHSEWFLDNEISKKELMQYKNYEDNV